MRGHGRGQTGRRARGETEAGCGAGDGFVRTASSLLGLRLDAGAAGDGRLEASDGGVDAVTPASGALALPSAHGGPSSGPAGWPNGPPVVTEAAVAQQRPSGESQGPTVTRAASATGALAGLSRAALPPAATRQAVDPHSAPVSLTLPAGRHAAGPGLAAGGGGGVRVGGGSGASVEAGIRSVGKRSRDQVRLTALSTPQHSGISRVES